MNTNKRPLLILSTCSNTKKVLSLAERRIIASRLKPVLQPFRDQIEALTSTIYRIAGHYIVLMMDFESSVGAMFLKFINNPPHKKVVELYDPELIRTGEIAYEELVDSHAEDDAYLHRRVAMKAMDRLTPAPTIRKMRERLHKQGANDEEIELRVQEKWKLASSFATPSPEDILKKHHPFIAFPAIEISGLYEAEFLCDLNQWLKSIPTEDREIAQLKPKDLLKLKDLLTRK